MRYSLVGVDGNAFSVVGYVRKAMREHAYSQKEIDEFSEKATSGDYAHLVSLCQDMLDELNAKYNDDYENYLARAAADSSEDEMETCGF